MRVGSIRSARRDPTHRLKSVYCSTAPDLGFNFLATSEPTNVIPTVTVPEPGTLGQVGLVGLGAAACGFVARRRKPVASR